MACKSSCRTTSKAVASKAAKVLNNPSAGKTAKSLAGTALAQARKCK